MEQSEVIALTGCWAVTSGAEMATELMVVIACSVSDPAAPTNQA